MDSLVMKEEIFGPILPVFSPFWALFQGKAANPSYLVRLFMCKAKRKPSTEFDLYLTLLEYMFLQTGPKPKQDSRQILPLALLYLMIQPACFLPLYLSNLDTFITISFSWSPSPKKSGLQALCFHLEGLEKVGWESTEGNLDTRPLLICFFSFVSLPPLSPVDSAHEPNQYNNTTY